jgi:glycosyltransferase involved in cell wall biosynthesis
MRSWVVAKTDTQSTIFGLSTLKKQLLIIMKILHLWYSDYLGGGGGSISMNRLHRALRRAGVDSKIMCERKTTASEHVTLIPARYKIERFIRFFTSRLGLNDVHSISSFRIKRHKAYMEADILHFHGLLGGFINYLALPYLTNGKPTIFTLKSMWCLTGHCAYSYDCDRWKIGCGKCPYPDVPPPIQRDATRLEWKLKNWAYSKSKITVVTTSTWLTELAEESMLSRFPIHRIPHGVDTEIYRPLDPQKCKSLLGIPIDKKVLMFMSINTADYRKGGDLLIKALKDLPESLKSETVLLILGSKGDFILEGSDMQVVDLGFVSSDHLKAIAYSAADLFIFPTRMDAFGLVSIESQSCGTPVISFRNSGVPDHVRPGISGYLAENENVNDLRHGIIKLLENESLRIEMSEQCRSIILKEYGLQLQAERHIELYRQLLEN